MLNNLRGNNHNVQQLIERIKTRYPLLGAVRMDFLEGLNDEDMKGISSEFKNNPHIKCINIPCEMSAKKVAWISEILSQNPNIEGVEFHVTEAGVKGVKHILEVLLKLPNIGNVNFNDNGIGDEGIKCISESLLKNNNIRVVNFSNNKISDKGAKYISEVLSKNNNIEVLNFSNNEISDEGIKCISEALLKNNNIRVVNFSNNKIGDKGAKCISEALLNNPNIENVDLGYNKIGDDGAKYISKIFLGTNNIKKIKLGYNEIGNKGAKYISEALLNNPNIENVDLGYNKIGDDGAKYISEALLRIHNIIEYVNLGHNEIGDEGVKYISRALEKNCSVVHIDLMSNNIGRNGLKCILNALRSNLSAPIFDDLMTWDGRHCNGSYRIVHDDVITYLLQSINDVYQYRNHQRYYVDTIVNVLRLPIGKNGGHIPQEVASHISDFFGGEFKKEGDLVKREIDLTRKIFVQMEGLKSKKQKRTYIDEIITSILSALDKFQSDKKIFLMIESVKEISAKLTQIGNINISIDVLTDIREKFTELFGVLSTLDLNSKEPNKISKAPIIEEKEAKKAQEILDDVQKNLREQAEKIIKKKKETTQQETFEVAKKIKSILDRSKLTKEVSLMSKMADDINIKLKRVDIEFISLDVLREIRFELKSVFNDLTDLKKDGLSIPVIFFLGKLVQETLGNVQQELLPPLKKRERAKVMEIIQSMLDKSWQRDNKRILSLADVIMDIKSMLDKIDDEMISLDVLTYIREEFETLVKRLNSPTNLPSKNWFAAEGLRERKVQEILNDIQNKIYDVAPEFKQHKDSKNFVQDRGRLLGHF
jgi:Ran GTPase-activating protein (RanGAP) involved in mRNA processing and transport